MNEHAQHHPARHAALIGLVGLAAAMGIGRFAFTPMLPLMQMQDSVSLTQAGYLASSNYVGYLLGALLCFALNPRPIHAATAGLAAVAVSTLAMGLTSSVVVWLSLRLTAGVASAFVLVGVSAWTLAVLAADRRSIGSGWVFAGVGVGIVFTGLAVLVIGAVGLAPAIGWLMLGAVASLAALFAASAMRDPARPTTTDSPHASDVLDLAAWRLIICYGTYGFGYIIPASFLPAAARALISDPAIFGWIWPLFGLAAAASTIGTASVLGSLTPRRTWAFAQIVMAAGVALPALQPTLAAIIISAVCVGGTFMVIAMAGMQEARRAAGSAAARLMAAMTAAFAIGQLVGPLTVSAAGSAVEAIRAPSLLAATLLLFTGLALLPGSANCGVDVLDRT